MRKEKIYLKIEIPVENKETDKIREEGLFFVNIADSLFLDRDDIIEIDDTNYEKIISEIKNKF